ncbi:hypothetical protein DN402_31850 [Streptomyces sp. SW4]|nr:hypothetical protein DN402_31850 [Streptomyces sp. SW4]
MRAPYRSARAGPSAMLRPMRADDRWTPRFRHPQPPGPVQPLDVNREAKIRQLHEDLRHENTLAAAGARAAIDDLLREVSRLRRRIEAMGADPDDVTPPR